MSTATTRWPRRVRPSWRLAAGGYRGPLHGVPVAYKDIYDVQGLPTTAASKIMAGYIASEDSTAAARLRQAGAICMGKLNTLEFASGSMEVFGSARNPWHTDMTPGGSSSGSGTALAACLVHGATGSDTGGSIRGPASFCGIVGIKPTYGRVSRAGVIPLSWSSGSRWPYGADGGGYGPAASRHGWRRPPRYQCGASAGAGLHRRTPRQDSRAAPWRAENVLFRS